MLTHYRMGGTSVEGRGVKLDAPEAWTQALRQFKPGRVIVHVEVEKNTRTARANRYYWGIVLRQISDHTGYEIDELHDYFKLQFNPKLVNIGGDEQTVGASTKSLDTQKFYDYVERIRRFASIELGITLPDPDQREVA